ncbi:MAG: CocE/NonD family hydrolase, partial [Deltaproteobacteria bacterium]|nr:CocE/NonD family hydrolase [Deltaproteobacteria bacterium]
TGAMFNPKWKTSERKYGFLEERDVKIPMPDGTRLSCDLWRPDSEGKFPGVLGFHCYHQSAQTGPIRPTAISSAQWKNPGQERTNASLEAGDPIFFARRGYAHVVCNARGTGLSEGNWHFSGPQEVQDVYDTIEWIAEQPWCDGNVAMFGVSYFAWIQLLVAPLNPPHLKTIFCPWGSTDFYRDIFYRGGIFAYKWPVGWSQTSHTYAKARPENYSKNELGEEAYRQAVEKLLEDDDIQAATDLAAVLKNPEAGPNPFVVDLALHPLYDRYWEERTVDYSKIKIPAYIGSDWACYGIHLPAAFRSWEKLDVPKKMIIGPPIYLDRPLGQLQHEAVRWFDHWMRGIDTGIMDEPPVRAFIMNTGEWKEGDDWPYPETKFTPFYLHEDNLLSEHEHWSYEGSDSFEDSPWGRGSLMYATPPIVENTEVIGPIMLKLFAATTDTDINWIISLLEIDKEGNERLLTKGWLKGSHRELDMAASKPWEPIHTHRKSEPLTPGEIYEFNIKVIPTGNLFKAGSRIGLKIACVDDPPKTSLQLIGTGSLSRAAVSRITVFHNEDYPSYLLLPITRGNILNTYFSGGTLSGSSG